MRRAPFSRARSVKSAYARRGRGSRRAEPSPVLRTEIASVLCGSRSLRAVGAPRGRSSRSWLRCEHRSLASNRERRFRRVAHEHRTPQGGGRRRSGERCGPFSLRLEIRWSIRAHRARQPGPLRASSAAPRDGRARSCVFSECLLFAAPPRRCALLRAMRERREQRAICSTPLE